MFKTPAMPCVCDVLNLLSQVGILLGDGVLAEAYHLTATTERPFIGCWLKTGLRDITHMAGCVCYTSGIRACKGSTK